MGACRIVCSSLFFYILIFFVTGFYPGGSLQAQFRIGVEVENYTASRTTNPGEFLAGRTRLRTSATYRHSQFRLHSHFDLFAGYDQPLNTGVTLRELYTDLYLGNFDIRAGRQKLVTGGMDGVTVADILSPTNLNEIVFLNSDDIRSPLDAISATYFVGSNSFTMVMALYRPPSILPDTDSRWSPFFQSDSQLELLQIQSPNGSFSEDLVTSLKYQARGPRADYSFSLLNWVYPVPAIGLELEAGNTENPVLFLFETLDSSPMATATISAQITPSVRVAAEALYAHRRLFTFLPFDRDLFEQAESDPFAALRLISLFSPREDRYLISSPWWSAGTGFRFEFSRIEAEFQFAVDYISNHTPEMVQERVFSYSTLLLTRSFIDERLRMSSFNRFNINGNDFWSQLHFLYEATDKLELSGGLSLFGGREPDPLYGHLSFSPFRSNSFFYTRIRYFL